MTTTQHRPSMWSDIRRAAGEPDLPASALPAEPTGVEAVDEACARLRALDEQARAARAELRTLEETRKKAERADAQAGADALRSSKPDPGPKAVAAHDKKLADARRRRDALVLAVADEGAALRFVVADRRDELAKAVAAKAASASKAWQAGLAKLRAALDDLHAASSTATFAERAGAGLSVEVPSSILPLTRANGGRWNARDLVDALDTLGGGDRRTLA